MVWSFVSPRQQMWRESWANERFRTVIIMDKFMVFSIVLEHISQIMIFALFYVVPTHNFFLSSSKAIADI